MTPTTKTVATEKQIQVIRAQAVNSVTREIRARGIIFTHDQADAIGNIGPRALG